MTISEDQEDELLSIVKLKSGTKAIVGSTEGVLTVWNRKSGWGDCEFPTGDNRRVTHRPQVWIVYRVIRRV